MKKVGKTTRPFRYDPNQIPYDYTVEVTNRFKGLDLIACHCTGNPVQEAVIKTISKKRNAKRQNDCLRGLTNSNEKKRSERQRRKGKIHLFECRVPKNSKER